MCSKSIQRGLTLIELLVFIVIVGVAATAILSVMGTLTRRAADLLPETQAHALAAGLLDEILAQPSTFCDPDAPNAATATAATVAACGGPAENAIGPEAGETRASFDNVNDYHAAANLAGLLPDGVTPIAGLPGYTAQVTVQNAALFAGIPASETLRVTVRVTAPNGSVARVEGVRLRHAPNT